MRKTISSITIIFIAFTSFAQKIDSIAIKQSLMSKANTIDSSAVKLYAFAKENTFFMADLLPQKFNNLNIAYGFTKGNYIPVHDASQIKTLSFCTEGKTILEKFNLYGSFNYQRSYEDSTKWAHQTRLNLNSPYYFGSRKNNHYERSLYKFKGVASRNMMGNNLPVSFGVDYRVGDHFSNNDPRGDVKDFQLNFNPTIGYTFFNKIKIGVGYEYGYGQERINVGYKNGTYFENTVAEIYTNYLITGYGGAKIVQQTNLIKYDNDQQRQYLQFFANYTVNKNNSIFLALKKGEENQIFKRYTGDIVKPTALMDYNIEQNSANLLWQNKQENRTLLVAAQYNYQAGAAYDYEHAGINYINDRETLGFNGNLTINQSKNLIHNLQIGANYLQDIKKDGNNAVNISYSRINLDAGYGINKQIDKTHSYGIAAKILYSFNSNSSFDAVISNENIIYKNVIYPDYLFNTSNNYAIGLTADYSFPTYKGIQTAIKISTLYREKVGNYTDLNRDVLNTPGNNRFASNISLNLYF